MAGLKILCECFVRGYAHNGQLYGKGTKVVIKIEKYYAHKRQYDTIKESARQRNGKSYYKNNIMRNTCA